MADVPSPQEEILLTHFIVSDDVERSRRFYTEVLGGRVAFSSPGGPTNVALSNSWIVINSGGGPTDDKPEVTLETPGDPNRVSSFVNIRVKDIETVYSEWSARGAQFLTPPKQHQYETRCYVRDPDGYLIEVGQTTNPEGDWWPWLSRADPGSERRDQLPDGGFGWDGIMGLFRKTPRPAHAGRKPSRAERRAAERTARAEANLALTEQQIHELADEVRRDLTGSPS
jgi:catechol 2,3-dioxygenase-like lactoylglutathione lyase family enzyme